MITLPKEKWRYNGKCIRQLYSGDDSRVDCRKQPSAFMLIRESLISRYPTPPPSIGNNHRATPDTSTKLAEHIKVRISKTRCNPPASALAQLCMDNQGGTVGVGAHGSASSPVSARSVGGGGGKRKRSGAGFDSSPGSGGEVEDEEAERRRQPGVKRACNECRQQKVSHHQAANSNAQ
jgi:hypothetical protein